MITKICQWQIWFILQDKKSLVSDVFIDTDCLKVLLECYYAYEEKDNSEELIKDLLNKVNDYNYKNDYLTMGTDFKVSVTQAGVNFLNQSDIKFRKIWNSTINYYVATRYKNDEYHKKLIRAQWRVV